VCKAEANKNVLVGFPPFEMDFRQLLSRLHAKYSELATVEVCVNPAGAFGGRCA
jgi:hypothetical protein